MHPHDNFPSDFMDFIDYLQGWRPQMAAISDMLCWIEHPMSEDELHRLSMLMQHLVEDLEAQTNKAYEEWKQEHESQKAAG